MRKYLLIVPEATAPAGLIGETLIGEGAIYDAVMPVERHASHAPFNYPGIPNQVADYAGLIVLGGPMSANETDKHPFLAETMSLIQEFAAADRPVLGICLGAQIIARAFGGEVYRMDRLESGFYTMNVTPEGQSDPVFAALGDQVTSFQNHFEAVRDIPGAVPLATGGACPIQAFRIGRATYATQFHPEVTIDIVRDWIRKFGTAFTNDEPRLLTDLDRQFRENFARHRTQCQLLVRNWMVLSKVP
ncbi:type 1 glutamine amidotransferase [Dongia deserti]|uniref:type 1 glutamine amidotransferase n=1 Tax=Dongia deserti TaxID=2268030 RepID=UPI000E64EC4A|nr:type 1 glutamine amidotransferase [Dongia deserti]